MKLPKNDHGSPHFLVFLAAVLLMGFAVGLFTALKALLTAPPVKSMEHSQSPARQAIHQGKTPQSHKLNV